MSDLLDHDQFEKNLARWNLFYPEQAKIIGELESKKIRFFKNEREHENLESIEEGFFYHSRENPVEEAQKWFASLDLKAIDMIMVFGVGLGYYYDAAKEWLHQNPSHQLVFLENDLEVLKWLFQTDKGTEILHDKQVWLAWLDPGNRILDVISGLFLTKKHVFGSLELYQNKHPERTLEVKSKYAFYLSLRRGVTSEYSDFGRAFFINFFRNLTVLHESYLGNLLFEKFDQVPAIICGAGPSLAKNMEILKTLRDKAVIFAGGTAMNALNAGGILPHIGVGIDPNPAQFTRLIMNNAYEVPFLYRNRFLHEALNIVHGDHLFVTGSSGYDVSAWFEEKLGIAGMNVSEGCNVINFSLSLAHAMGCNPIILVGLDLAYTNMQSYAPGIIQHPLHERRKYFLTKTADEELVPKMDIHGQPVFTLWKWISESFWFTDFALNHIKTILINSTEGGIGFEGIVNMPLSESAERMLSKEFDIDGMVSAFIKQAKMPSGLSQESIRKAMEEMLESLKKAEIHCRSIAKAFQDAERALRLGQEIPPTIVPEETLQVLVEIEQESAYVYILRLFSDMFLEISMHDHQRLEYDESLLSEFELNLKRASLNVARYSFLADAARVTARTIEAVIKEEADKRVYSLTRPASELPAKERGEGKGIYLFENGVLKIEDPELDIHIEDKTFSGKTPEPVKNYYPEGAVLSEQYFDGDLLHGPSAYFAEKGALLSKTWYVKGKKEGKAFFYYEDGTLNSIRRYKDGQWHGMQEFFYSDGNVKSRMSYSSGLLDGEVRLYFPNGRLHRELAFALGKRIGFERVWSPLGSLLIEAEFDYDKPIGTARQWYENGNLAKEVVYQPGSADYTVREWDLSGQFISSPHIPQKGDYFDQVAMQSEKLTHALNDVVSQVKGMLPMVEVALPKEAKSRAVIELAEEVGGLEKEMAHLQEVSRKLLYETGLDPSNPEEAIWKSAASKRELEKEIEKMTESLQTGLLDMQQVLSSTLLNLNEKLTKMVPLPKEQPSSENPENKG